MWRVEIASQFYPTPPPPPPYGSNWGHKTADFELLPYISFIVVFIAWLVLVKNRGVIEKILQFFFNFIWDIL